MKLNEEQQRIVLEKLKEYGLDDKKCDICGKSDWGVSTTIWKLTDSILPDVSNLGITTYPMVSVTCTECGNTYFFSGIKLGIVNMKKSEDDDIK